MDKVLEITTKLLLNKEVSDEERKYISNRNMKYQLVRHIFLEKINFGKKESDKTVSDFHFTPGDKFDEMSVYDIVSHLLDIDVQCQIAYDQKSNPPTTGLEKTKLI